MSRGSAQKNTKLQRLVAGLSLEGRGLQEIVTKIMKPRYPPCF